MRSTILALALFTGTAWLQAQNLSGVKAIAAWGNTSFALLSDGTVWWWGQDSTWDELLGGGEARPVRWWNLTDAEAISPTLALKTDGTVWAYSLDSVYPLNKNGLPVPGLSGVVAVASGGWRPNLALTGDGDVWALGSPSSQDGIGKWYGSVTRLSGVSEIVAIATGARNSLALKRDGTVWIWGDNMDGSLGDGLLEAPYSEAQILSTPVQVIGLGDVVAIAAGYGHSLALKSDGTVWAWGGNRHGELGDGTTQTRTAPVQVSGIDEVVKIAAGLGHSLAVKRDGTVWGWGLNVAGQVGDGTTTDRLNPVQVSGLSGVTAVAGGRFHSLALGGGGTVWAWGSDQYGELGDGVPLLHSWEDRRGPFQVVRLTGVSKIAAGWSHSLAVKADGTVRAWGDNYSGELGDGWRRPCDWPDQSAPVQVGGLAGVAAIDGGERFSLAVTRDGEVWQWGRYDDIRTGGWGYALAPVRVNGLLGVVSASGSVSYNPSSSYHSMMNYHLAVREDGSLWEWGVQQRQKGWPVEPIALEPAPVAGLSEVVAAVAPLDQNLAVKSDGTVWEWGIRNPATQVNGLTGVVAVAAACGNADYPDPCHSLALKNDGTVWAWGDNSRGQLGDGTADGNVTTAYRTTPVQISGLSDVVAIATRESVFMIGDAHSVAVKRDGTVWEWPIWEFGSFSAKSLVPVQVSGLSDIVAVAEGGAHSLALKRDGTVWAWGQNTFGQLGVQTLVIRTTPVQVIGPATH